MIECMNDWKLAGSVPAPRTPGSFPDRRDAGSTSAFQLSAADEDRSLERRDAWAKLIDHTLIEMGQHPERFSDVDEGVAPPTRKAIWTAYSFARVNGELRAPAPDEILPDGDGGITIRLALPHGATLSFEASAKGGCKLVLYRAAPLAPVELARSEPPVDAL